MNTHCVDIWVADLLAERANLAKHKSLLSKTELVKFEQFKNIKQAEYYAVVRALQRQILAKYLSIDPKSIQYAKGLHGKPELVEPKLFFNISHSADRLLVAVSAGNELGVDIELLKERSNLQLLVDRCFADEEQQYWSAVPDTNKLEFFYRLWVAKEAFVKAVGRGIALGMSNCALCLPDMSGFCVVPEEHGEADAWSLNFLNVDSAYAAAVVTKGDIAELTLRVYSD